MTAVAARLFVLALALALDRLVGDPVWLWRRARHPIALIGNTIGYFDRRLNDSGETSEVRQRRGTVFVLSLVIVAAAIGWAADFGLAHGIVGSLIEAVIVGVFLAQKSLVDHVSAVLCALVAGGVDNGRRAVSEIVGRDVTSLDEAGVARAAIKSAAENFSDGVVAPAFWYLVLGLPGLLIYKAVNTADSMIGHRSEQYRAFGWAAARLDDLLNFIPARLSALLIAGAAMIAGLDGRAAWRSALSDARLHKSPNAGWPEAAVAGALGLALGGPRSYGAESVDGAWLNAEGREAARPADIRASVWLIDAAWALLVVTVAALAFIGLASAR